MKKQQKKGLGVPRPKKSGSVSASKSSPKKAPGFPSTPSRKEIHISPEEYDKLVRTGFLDTSISMAPYRDNAQWGTPFGCIGDDVELPEYNALARIDGTGINRSDTTIDGNGSYWSWTLTLLALGIAAKNPQRVSARIRSGKPDPKGNAQKKKR